MANNDLISREAAKQFVRSERGAELLKHFHLNAIIVLNLIDEVPAADAAPVVCGQWVDFCGDIVCSVCGAHYNDEIVYMYQSGSKDDERFTGLEYCPHCGARMSEFMPTGGAD